MSETRCTCDPHPTWPHEPDCPRAQPRPEHIYTAGWREGWEAAKLATHRIPNIAEALDAWRLSESKQAIRDGAEGETAEGLSAAIERLPTIRHDGVQWVNKTAVLLVIGALRNPAHD